MNVYSWVQGSPKGKNNQQSQYIFSGKKSTLRLLARFFAFFSGV
jgi:hypothetical protein